MYHKILNSDGYEELKNIKFPVVVKGYYDERFVCVNKNQFEHLPGFQKVQKECSNDEFLFWEHNCEIFKD